METVFSAGGWVLALPGRSRDLRSLLGSPGSPPANGRFPGGGNRVLGPQVPAVPRRGSASPGWKEGLRREGGRGEGLQTALNLKTWAVLASRPRLSRERKRGGLQWKGSQRESIRCTALSPRLRAVFVRRVKRVSLTKSSSLDTFCKLRKLPQDVLIQIK